MLRDQGSATSISRADRTNRRTTRASLRQRRMTRNSAMQPANPPSACPPPASRPPANRPSANQLPASQPLATPTWPGRWLPPASWLPRSAFCPCCRCHRRPRAAWRSRRPPPSPPTTAPAAAHSQSLGSTPIPSVLQPTPAPDTRLGGAPPFRVPRFCTPYPMPGVYASVRTYIIAESPASFRIGSRSPRFPDLEASRTSPRPSPRV